MKFESIQQLFGRAAKQFATDIAIERGGVRITYAELEARSNKLANFLIRSGASKGSIVAILAKDTIEAIAAIIGVLKAGCVFVPLDPDLPEKRLEAMLSLASPEWYVIESQFFEIVNSVTANNGSSGKVICIDGEDLPTENPGNLARLHGYVEFLDSREPVVTYEPDDMCYIYFTSGSTGVPKAIAGRLKGIEHFIKWEINALNLVAGDRVSQFLPLSFDGSLRDIFAPLCAGGTVCAPQNREEILDAGKLIEWIDGNKIKLIHCVPSLFRSIVNEELNPDHFRSLKYILMAGEPLLPSDVKRWMDVYGERVQLVNLYGTSETTMAKFIYFVKSDDKDRRSIPIGKPMEGAAAVIVDAKGWACPPGAIGEIYIRTPFRSLGYYNNPELTNEAFIKNPFSNDPNDIVYKTGDLGRVLEDGTFEYLGRKDQQVKIRGVRVELEEIENLLRSHEAIEDVAVVEREDSAGYKYLCAYVVLNKDLEISSLRDFTLTYLPDYMVPSSFMVMESLPRTISGKLNRRSLPSPGETRAGKGQSYVAPRTQIEEVVANAWASVLGLERVGVNDNFFQLGGHSLRATQVLARVRAILKVEIPLRSLFEAPTVAGLSERIEASLREGHGVNLPPIRRVSRDGELPLSFAQQRLWFLHQLEPHSPAHNLPTAIRLTGTLDVEALTKTLSEIVRRHEVLRTTFATVNDRPVQQIAPAEAVTLPVLDLSQLPEAERESRARRLIAEEARQPFNITQSPPFRVTLLRMGVADHVVIFTMDHIIADGWSIGVLIKEVELLYRSFLTGKESPLPELAIQYADFAHWQREWMQGEVLRKQLGYWKEQLKGKLPVMELPTDRARPEAQSYRGGAQYLEVKAELAAELKRVSRQEGVTLFMTLLAGFKTLLYRYCGQEDIIVGSPIANRNHPETEALIGCLINTLVLRTDLSGDPTFRELLARVRDITLGAYANQDAPFELIVETLQPDRKANYTPLFQIWFVLQNAPFQSLELEGLTLTRMDAESEIAQFDLILSLHESAKGIKGTLLYNRDLFDADTVAEMLIHFNNLLEAIAENPDKSLLDIPLSQQEREGYASAAPGLQSAEHAEDQFII